MLHGANIETDKDKNLGKTRLLIYLITRAPLNNLLLMNKKLACKTKRNETRCQDKSDIEPQRVNRRNAKRTNRRDDRVPLALFGAASRVEYGRR